jgi:hypothetical protein
VVAGVAAGAPVVGAAGAPVVAEQPGGAAGAVRALRAARSGIGESECSSAKGSVWGGRASQLTSADPPAQANTTPATTGR